MNRAQKLACIFLAIQIFLQPLYPMTALAAKALNDEQPSTNQNAVSPSESDDLMAQLLEAPHPSPSFLANIPLFRHTSDTRLQRWLHTQPEEPSINGNLRERLEEHDQIDVIVKLRMPPEVMDNLEARQMAIAEAQELVINDIPEADFEVIYQYTSLPLLAGFVNEDGLTALLENEAVEAISENAW